MANNDEEKTIEVLPPRIPAQFIDLNIVEATKNFLEITGLPKDAFIPVLNMVQQHFALQNLIDRQRSLPDSARASLVGSRQTITPVKLRIIDDFVATYGFPYNALYIAQDGNVAVRSMGWRMKALADPRVFRGFEDTPIEMINLEDGNIVFRTRVVALFLTGEKFPAEGWSDINELQARRANTQAPPSYAAMICQTRAHTRAWRLALGLPFDIAEDIISTTEEATKETTAIVTAEPQGMGISQFLAECKEIGLKVPDILARLNITNLGQIADYREALIKLRGGVPGEEVAKASDAPTA